MCAASRKPRFLDSAPCTGRRSHVASLEYKDAAQCGRLLSCCLVLAGAKNAKIKSPNSPHAHAPRGNRLLVAANAGKRHRGCGGYMLLGAQVLDPRGARCRCPLHMHAPFPSRVGTRTKAAPTRPSEKRGLPRTRTRACMPMLSPFPATSILPSHRARAKQRHRTHRYRRR